MCIIYKLYLLNYPKNVEIYFLIIRIWNTYNASFEMSLNKTKNTTDNFGNYSMLEIFMTEFSRDAGMSTGPRHP